MNGQGQSAVLVADDDAGIRLVCRVNLELEGYRVLEASTADELRRILDDEHVDAVLLDIRLGPDDGLALARGLHASRPDIGVAIFSGSIQRPEEAAEFAEGYLPKPFTLEQLRGTVADLLAAGREARA